MKGPSSWINSPIAKESDLQTSVLNVTYFVPTAQYHSVHSDQMYVVQLVNGNGRID